MNHCAFNIALTGAVNRWCMTERPRSRVQLTADTLCIGRSGVHWNGQEYQFELEERGCPLPRRVRGSVRVRPLLQPGIVYRLDRAGHHLWTPLAPKARVSVELREPALSWCGDAYVDSNRGDRALEQDFHGWQWSRATTAHGTTVFYETRHRHEDAWPLAVRFGRDDTRPITALPDPVDLPRSGWGIGRRTRSTDPQQTRVLRTLLDAPFYARSLLCTRLDDEYALTVHESLDLERFRSRWVQWMLPFRMPRLQGPQRTDSASIPAR